MQSVTGVMMLQIQTQLRLQRVATQVANIV